MIENDADSLRSELSDLADLLGDIRSGTKLLIDDGNDSKKIRLNSNPSLSSSSSWAKSTTPRVGVKLKDNITPCNLSSSLQVEKAEKYIRKKAAAYTIGSKIVSKTIESSAPSPLYYNANIDASSSYKTSKGTVFSKTSRNIELGQKNNDNINVKIEEQLKPSTATTTNHNDTKTIGEKAYSFGKAPRVNNMSNTNTCNPNSTYDVEKSEKYLLPNTPSLRLVKPVVDNKNDQKDDDNNNDNNDERNVNDENNNYNNDSNNKVDNNTIYIKDNFLSTRSRAPSAIMKPEVEKKITINDITKLLGTPGPGQYDVDKVFKSDHTVSQNKKRSVGKIYFDKSKMKLEVALRRAWSASSANIDSSNSMDLNNMTNNNNITPGPNYYDVLSADRYLRQSNPNIVITPAPDPKSDDKHIQRKRYWEEKAKDLRETHDYMKDANESFISSSKLTRSIIIKKEKDWDDNFDNPKALKVMKRRKEEADKSLVYDVKHDAIEKKTPLLLQIEKQVNAQKKIEKEIFGNPRIAQVFAEKKQSEYERDRYYGPQLPVQWVVDNKKYNSNNDNDDVIEEVMQIIKERDPNINDRMKSSNLTSETALNYANSIYSGTLTKANVIMRKSEEEKFDKVPDGPQDFIGPQLPVDWTELSKGHALRMDLGKGRDQVKVHGKGIVQVVEFSETNIDDEDQVGPGKYNTLKPFGEDAKGVPFKLNVARRDATGPHGELPESAQESLARAIDDSFFEIDMLDIDYAIAKDEATKKTVKGLPLYRKDRYEEEKIDPGQANHVGGTWFKGMAEEGMNKKAFIDIGKMQGRDDNDDDKKLLENDEEFAEVKLDLDVKDWNPRMPKPVFLANMSDPETQPRFPKEQVNMKDHDAPPTPTPNYDYVKVRDKFAFVDMSKQVGRDDDTEHEKNLVLKEVEGYVDQILVDQLAAEREANLIKAKEITGKLKRVPPPIDMSKNAVWDDKFKIIEEPTPPVQEATSPVQPRIKGTSDWSKIKGRDESVDLSKLDVLLEKEELDLQVNPVASSRFKQPKSALSWDKSKSISRFEEVKSTTNDLDYGDVDATKFKKGSSKGGATNMNSRAGRGEDEEKELFKKILGNEEVLDVVPDDTSMKRNVSSSSFGKSSSSKSILSDSTDTKKATTAIKKKSKRSNENINESTSDVNTNKKNDDEVLKSSTINTKKTVSFGSNNLNELDMSALKVMSPPPTPLLSIPDITKSPPKKMIEGFKDDVTTSQMIEKLDESLKQMNI